MQRETLPPTYFYASLALMMVLHVESPGAQLLPNHWRLVGWLGIVGGAALNIVADRARTARKTAGRALGPSSESDAAAILRYAGDPMKNGMVLIVLGIASGLGTLAPFLVCAGFAMLLWFGFIPLDERSLSKGIGEMQNAHRPRSRAQA